MSMSPADGGNILGGIIGGGALAWWLIRRSVARVDALEEKVNEIQLKMAGELPSKEDVTQLVVRLDRLETTLGEVRDMARDMAIRFDEREKARHG